MPAPANTARPTIVGNATVGSTLSASPGTWTGDAPISYGYLWARIDAGGRYWPIMGATSSSHVVSAQDQAHALAVTVYAQNSLGNAYAYSDPSATVPGSNTLLRADRMGYAMGPRIWLAGSTERTNTFNFMNGLGAKWALFDCQWDVIEPVAPVGGAHTYQWATMDALVNGAIAVDVKNIVLRLWCTPVWARDPASTSDLSYLQNKWPPLAANLNDWLAFVAAVITRYRGKIVGVECWSQPNTFDSWRPGPEIGGSLAPSVSGRMDYKTLLIQSASLIGQTDPFMRVLAGGSSPAATSASFVNGETANTNNAYTGHAKWLSAPDYASDLYAAGCKGFFHGLALHPYSYPANPLNGVATNPFTEIQAVYNIMAVNADTQRLIWGTEAGAPTGADGNETSSTPSPDTSTLTKAQQAQWVNDYLSGWFAKSYVGPFLWYMPTDTSPTDYSIAANNFGLAWLHADGTVAMKPAGANFAANASQPLVVAAPPPDPTNPTVRHYSNLTVPLPLAVAVGPGDAVLQFSKIPNYPTPPYLITIERQTVREEVCLVTSSSPVSMTVVRGWDRPSVAHAVGSAVEHTIDAREFEEVAYHWSNPTHNQHTQHVREDIVVAKGDLFVFDGTNVVRMGVGPTTDSALTVDPTAVNALSWALAFPPGTVQFFAQATPPSGWLFASGGVASRSTYAALFSAIGTTYGNGDGSGSTFSLPDLRSRSPIGTGKGATSMALRSLAQTGGEETHHMTVNGLATHIHVQDAHNHAQQPHYHTLVTPGAQFVLSPGSGQQWTIPSVQTGFVYLVGDRTLSDATALNDPATATNQNIGGNGRHNVMQPYLVLTPAIKI